jgi:hypothetical protein
MHSKINKRKFFPADNGVEPVVRALRDAGVRVLLYYGDTDLLCDALLGQKFAQSLGYNVSCHLLLSLSLMAIFALLSYSVA